MLKDSFQWDGGQVSQVILHESREGSEWIQEFCGTLNRAGLFMNRKNKTHFDDNRRIGEIL
jgi:hypothetical protein